jgi:hypothetical protein
MINDLDPDPEQRQRAAEAAFVRSAEYTFLGRKLEPFSFTRQTAAEMLGLRHGSLSAKDIVTLDNDRKQLLTNGAELTPEERAKIEAEPAQVSIYRGMARDIALLLWLMHQPAAVCRAARANPSQYDEAIDQWAESIGLDRDTKVQGEAGKVFSQVMADLAASRGQPEVPPAKDAAAPKNA